MIEQQVEIINKLGLHARASAKLVSTAAQFSSRIQIEYASQSADAKSIMAMMMLAASQGSHIIVRAEGRDEQQAVEAIVGLIDNYFDEEE